MSGDYRELVIDMFTRDEQDRLDTSPTSTADRDDAIGSWRRKPFKRSTTRIASSNSCSSSTTAGRRISIVPARAAHDQSVCRMKPAAHRRRDSVEGRRSASDIHTRPVARRRPRSPTCTASFAAGSGRSTTSTPSMPSWRPRPPNAWPAIRCGCSSCPAPATRKPKRCRRSPAPAPSSPARSARKARCSRPVAKRERAKDATGGLLRRLGARGLLVIKDVTSILSMNRDTRAALLAALREIHDGRWERNVGTDGGRTPDLDGPDRRHRRRDDRLGPGARRRRAAWAIASSSSAWIRRIGRLSRRPPRLPQYRRGGSRCARSSRPRSAACSPPSTPAPAIDADGRGTRTHSRSAANVVTLARTGVDYDYRGDVIDAHAPEMPTRFAKQLTQLLRGALAIGLPRATALRLAIRCARDSMPPLRLAIVDDIAAHPGLADQATSGGASRSRGPPSIASCRRCTCSAC